MFYRLISIFTIFLSFSIANDDIKNINSFKAEFTQIITSATNDKIDYKGEVFIKNDGKILWKYKTPITKNVYVLNDYAIVDEPELEQAIYTSLENEVNIIKLLNEAQKINEKEYLSKIDGIDYLIEVANGKIDKINYKDNLDNKIVINFSKIIQNEQLDDKLFKFVAPSYYDIIRK